MDAIASDEFVDIYVASQLLACHPLTVRELVRRGLLTCYRGPRQKRLFRPADVARVKHLREPRPEAAGQGGVR
jgi:DNA-binding transcriptional MerR regulator